MESDAAIAKSTFRFERLQEPLDLYNQFFTTFADIFAELIDRLPDIGAEPVNAELIADLIDGRDAQKAFRYLTAPPISEDDLETMADATHRRASRSGASGRPCLVERLNAELVIRQRMQAQ